jgi:alpha-1,4-digalacturonate transport system permease protein
MKTKISNIVRTIFFLLFALIWAFPVIWMVLSSFKPGSELFSYPLFLFPKHPTAENFFKAVNSFDIIRYTVNSLFVTLIATVLTIFLSSMCGFALAKYHYKWLSYFFLCLLATTMLPAEIIMNPSFTVIFKLGLYNSLWGCVVPCIGSMTGIFLMRQFFISVPDDLMEAARIDGANEGTIFTRIMFPICNSQVVILAIFSFRWRWNDYVWPLISLYSKDKYTLQLALRSISDTDSVSLDWSLLLAASVLTMIPVLIIFIIFNKKIMSSSISSGIKG